MEGSLEAASLLIFVFVIFFSLLDTMFLVIFNLVPIYCNIVSSNLSFPLHHDIFDFVCQELKRSLLKFAIHMAVHHGYYIVA